MFGLAFGIPELLRVIHTLLITYDMRSGLSQERENGITAIHVTADDFGMLSDSVSTSSSHSGPLRAVHIGHTKAG